MNQTRITPISDARAARVCWLMAKRRRCLTPDSAGASEMIRYDYLGWRLESEVHLQLVDRCGRPRGLLVSAEYWSAPHGRRTGTQAMVSLLVRR